MSRLYLFTLGVTILLTACTANGHPGSVSQPVLPPSPPPTATSTSTPTMYPSPPETPAIVATSIMETATLPPTETPLPLLTITPADFPLAIPTIIPVEGAEYRPPLYSVPWALSPFDHFYFARPIAATYPADPHTDYLYGGLFFDTDIIHSGIDLPAPYGTEVLAAGPGTVLWAGPGLYSKTPGNIKDPYGLAVAIRHDFGYHGQPLFTIYAHMQEVDVIPGQWVDTGDVLGNVGSTGHATGPHLHFEVRLGKNDFWSTLNPELWIAPPEGYGVLAGRVMTTSGMLMDSALVVVRSLANEKIYWYLHTYAHGVVNRDPYYDENFVMGNLPAGAYELTIPYQGWDYQTKIQVLAGQVNYFTFSGWWRFNFSLPPTPNIAPIP